VGHARYNEENRRDESMRRSEKGGVPMDANERAEFVSLFPVWDHLSPPEQEETIRQARVVHYEDGRRIHQGGDECLGLLLLRKGGVRVYMLSEDGREITLYRLDQGSACILTASCVLSTITFDVHVDAEGETEAYLLDAPYWAELCRQNIYVECLSYRLATERFSEVMWAMQQILFMSLDRRLAVFLSDELVRGGGDTIHLTHEQVARYMGSAREAVSRMLKYFSSEGIVELSRGGIHIKDKKKLRALAAH